MENKKIKNSFLIPSLFFMLVATTTYGKDSNRNFLLNKNTFKISYKELENFKVFHYPNGNIKSEQFFFNDKKFGTWKFYYESGELKSLVTFDPYSSVEVATVINYDTKGVIISSGKTIDKEMVGLWKYYDENGKLNHSFDHSEGVITLFNENEETILSLKENEVIEKLEKILREVKNDEKIRDF